MIDSVIMGSLRNGRLLLFPAVIILVFVAGVGLLITGTLADIGLLRWDSGFPASLIDDREGEVVRSSLILTTLSATPTIVTLAATAVVVCRLMFKRWLEAFFVVLAVAGETAIFMLTTMIVHRPRPNVPKLDAVPPTSSYPSGHTAAAVCFYGAVAALAVWHTRHRWLHAFVIAVAVVLPPLIGVSRVLRGMHHPLDVVGGLLLGVLWLAVVTRWVHTHATPEADQRRAAA